MLTKSYVLTVILNDVTKQSYVAINDVGAKSKGLTRIRGNYLDLERRVLSDVHGLNTEKRFDAGINWAIANSNLDDWREIRQPGEYNHETAVQTAEKISAYYERLGYQDVRSRFRGETKFMGLIKAVSWGKTKLQNTTPAQFAKKMEKIGKALGTTIPVHVVQAARQRVVRDHIPNQIKDKLDLYHFLVEMGIITDKFCLTTESESVKIAA